MRSFSHITLVAFIAGISTAYASGGLSVDTLARAQSTLSILSTPAHKLVKSKSPILVSVQKFSIPMCGQSEAVKLTQQILKRAKPYQLAKYKHGMSYYLTLSRPLSVAILLKKLGEDFNFNEYQYAGLDDNPININRYALLKYKKTKHVANSKIANSGNIYFGYGFNILPKIEKGHLSITTYYDSILPKKHDNLGLPSYQKLSFSNKLPIKHARAILAIWQNVSVEFTYKDKTQVLSPVRHLNIALLSYRYYPEYFQQADKEGQLMKEVLTQ